MKKVIEQDFFLYIGDIEVSTDSDGDIEVLQWNKNREGGCDIVHVGKSKAREVALSISPELESELKEAVDILDCFSRFDDEETDEKRLMYYEIIRKDAKAFLTKHKSKE